MAIPSIQPEQAASFLLSISTRKPGRLVLQTPKQRDPGIHSSSYRSIRRRSWCWQAQWLQ